MVMAMIFAAIHGAAAHVASTPGRWPKTKLAALLLFLSAKELLGFVALLPSISHSFLLYSTLPAHPPAAIASRPGRRLPWLGAFNVSVIRNIAYGPARRNLLDVYVPDEVDARQGRTEPHKWPAVMFVHGGIWATGSKELFSHLGAFLAHAGILTVIVQYTLFPEVLASQQVKEVSSALTWFLSNAKQYGADPRRLALMGHSSGAHLCGLVMWERFKAAQRLLQEHAAKACSLSHEILPEINEEEVVEEEDIRQPCKFVGMAGVYDVVGHLKHEQKRGVDALSCMTPAMGGMDGLEAMSPLHLFRSFRVGGKSANIGVNHNWVFSTSSNVIGDKINDLGAIGGRSFEADLPTCSLLCSWGDMVVPPDSSLAFHAVLQEYFGHQSGEVIVLKKVLHSDFIKLGGTSPEQVLLQRHILEILQR